MSANDAILVCQCAERRLVNVDGASGSIAPEQFVVVPDLCRAAAGHDPILGKAFAEIHACHSRAVRALFAFAGHPLPDEAVIHNHRIPVPLSPHPSPEIDPVWYPVIDYDRCTACGQCHAFCLFGVYEKTDEGKIKVAHPDQCKNNCPACARICPETAIVFPKCGEEPINGAEIDDESVRKAHIKVNVDEILGGDVYASLQTRAQKRRTLLDRKKIEQALAEREACRKESA